MKVLISRLRSSQGYALIDVLLAVFLFSMGFAVLYGLTEGALKETQSSLNLTEAANLAQKRIEQLAANPWEGNFSQGLCLPGAFVQGQEGKFSWVIYSEWEDLPNLLAVDITVRWQENKSFKSYGLGSLFYVR